MSKNQNPSVKFWTINNIAFVITAIGFVVSLGYIYYSEYLKQPNITWSIQSDEQIFTVNNSIDSLEISYNGENLLDRKDELRLLTLNIKNTGSVNIEESMYSNSLEYGFTVERAEIISSPEIVYRSKEYIEKEIDFNYKDQAVTLPHTVLDKGDEFLVKVLYFSKADSISIVPTGKIAGINLENVSIARKTDKPEKKGFSYGALIFLAFIALLYLYKLIMSFRVKNKVKKRRLRYAKFIAENNDIELPPRVKNRYIEDGKIAVIDILKLLSSESEIKSSRKAFEELRKANMQLMKYDQKLAKDYDNQFCKGYHEHTINRILHHDKKYIYQAQEPNTDIIGKVYNMDKVKVNVTESAKKFLEFLKYE